jgi:hypothetical protein
VLDCRGRVRLHAGVACLHRRARQGLQCVAQPAPFNCSGQEAPFSTAEYINADGNGADLMGAYVPPVRPRLPEVGDFQLMRRLRPSLPLRPC